MNTFQIPQYYEVSAQNQEYFDFFKKQLSALPNLYAMLAHSSTALQSYLSFHNRAQSLTIQEKEIIGLVVSCLNRSSYCLETHVMIARLNGFNDLQIEEIKSGSAKFNNRYNALTQVVYSIVSTKGSSNQAQFDRFFDEGFSKENFVDMLLCIGDVMITNLVTCSMRVPSDSVAADHV